MNFLYFLRILFIGIFQFFKSTRRIYIIARIDPHFLCVLSCDIGNLRIKMYIGHQRNHISLATQSDIDIHQILRFLDTLRCKADILATCVNNTFRLFHTSLRVLRRRICHRLDTNGIGAAQRHSPNIYF